MTLVNKFYDKMAKNGFLGEKTENDGKQWNMMENSGT